MPSVPYSGTLQVAPQDDPLPRYNADAMPAAFGVNVAQAIEGLGKTTGAVGDEIFARGMAMQDLHNHSEALEADAQYSMQAGQIWEDMKSKLGKDAVQHFVSGDYQKSLDDSRNSIRDSLSNDMSRKMFDASTLSTFTRTNLYGASHSAEQNKAYAVGSSKARIDAVGDRTLSTPADEGAFRSGLTDVETEVRAQGQLQGWGDDQVNEAITQQKSALWSQRIQGTVKSQPLAASKMLDQAVKDGEVRGQDIAKLTNMVQSANHTVGARMISHEVSTGASSRWGDGPVDIKQAANAIKEIESGGNYNSIGVQTSHGRALGAYQVMEEFLPEYLQRAGLPNMTTNEFLANHAAQDQVFTATFSANMKKTGSANDAASMWLTGKPQAEAGNVRDSLGTDSKTYVTRFNAALAKNAPLSAKVDLGQRIAAERTPDDPLMQDAVRDRIEGDHNRLKAVQRDDEFQNRQVIETALMGGQDGKLPTSVEELQADPKAGPAWDYLVENNPSTARRYMNVLAKNSKGDHNWTDQSLHEYQKFKGEAQEDPVGFLDRDVIGSDLPNSAKRELINLQGRLKGQAQGDPRVSRALGILAPDLQAAGITKTANKDDYYQFVGVLADQLQDFSETNKRPPKPDEVKKMGAQLLQARTTKGGGLFGLWDSTSPMFQAPVPSSEADKIKAEPAWEKLGIVPTQEQIQRIYTRKKYQDLYGKSPTALVPVSR